MSFALDAGPGFSLAAAADFGAEFPGTRVTAAESELRMSWALDGDWRTVRVVVHQHGTQIRGELEGHHPRELTLLAERDVRRILCLDVDAGPYLSLGHRDPVVGELQRRRPGLRPVLFWTPYEAAAWCLIGQRIQMRQAAVVTARLADELGEVGAFPAPARLAELTGPQRGLTDRKIDQLRELGRAARDGVLDRDRLRAMTVQDALADLQRLPGIGPFSAELVLIRGVGAPDALPTAEKRFEAAARQLYHLDPDDDLTAVTEDWRPFRSWVAFLVRATA